MFERFKGEESNCLRCCKSSYFLRPPGELRRASRGDLGGHTGSTTTAMVRDRYSYHDSHKDTHW